MEDKITHQIIICWNDKTSALIKKASITEQTHNIHVYESYIVGLFSDAGYLDTDSKFLSIG